MWKLFLRKNIVDPAVRRAGTMLAAFLIAKSLDAPTVDIIINGLTAAAGVSFDLVMSWLERQRAGR